MEEKELSRNNGLQTIQLLVEMHKYNDISAKHHETSRERNAHLFVIVYVFLVSVIVANLMGPVAIFFSLFLIVFSSFGFSLNLKHAELAMMHYWRNKRIRLELDKLMNGEVNFTQIFKLTREDHQAQFIKNVGRDRGKRIIDSEYHMQWARMHQIFRIFGMMTLAYLIVVLGLCRMYGDCKSNTEVSDTWELFQNLWGLILGN